MIDSAMESDREWDRRVRRAYVLNLRNALVAGDLRRVAELLDWFASHEQYKRELGIR